MREKLLGTKDLKLDKTIEILKTNQAFQFQVKDTVSVTLDKPVTVNKIRQRVADQKESRKGSRNRDQRQSRPSHKPDQQTTGSTGQNPCKFCGKKYEFKRELCPAADKEYHKCKKKEHFATVCLSGKKALHNLGEEESYSEKESYAVSEKTVQSITTVKRSMQVLVTCTVNRQHQVTFEIDTGASCNVLPFSEYACKSHWR